MTPRGGLGLGQHRLTPFAQGQLQKSNCGPDGHIYELTCVPHKTWGDRASRSDAFSRPATNGLIPSRTVVPVRGAFRSQPVLFRSRLTAWFVAKVLPGPEDGETPPNVTCRVPGPIRRARNDYDHTTCAAHSKINIEVRSLVRPAPSKLPSFRTPARNDLAGYDWIWLHVDVFRTLPLLGEAWIDA